MNLLLWEVYEVTSENDLQGVMFRGRLRKFALDKEINLLVENDELNKNCVRYATLRHQNIDQAVLIKFIKEKIDKDAEIKYIGFFQNPVLSKLKVNEEKRYSI